MKPLHGYLSNRVLKINVGFLIADGPGNSQDSTIHIPDPVRVADDLIVHHIDGHLRLSRMKEGVLVQSKLVVGADNTCSRCLTPIAQQVPVHIEELYAHPPRPDAEFSVGADAVLDLSPLLRAEVLIATSHKVLCREDCKGLCPECGSDLNLETCQCDRERIDPRLARLRELLDSAD